MKIPDNWREDQSYQKQRYYNWREDPYFKLDKDHPRPFMRPQVQALINKLRKLEMMKQPGTAEEVIWDIAYQRLYREAQWGRLANISARLAQLWATSYITHPIGPPEPENLAQVAALPDTVDDGPSQVSVPVPEAPVLNLEELLTKSRSGIEDVIIRHQLLTPDYAECICGRPMPTDADYAKHLRIRIYAYIKNEFPPFGTPG